jgi:hypothetical protein
MASHFSFRMPEKLIWTPTLNHKAMSATELIF